MQLGETPDQREPDAQPALRSVERTLALNEQVEHARQQFGLEPDARVGHGDRGRRAIAACADAHRAAPRRVLERVGREIRDDLIDARGVGVHPDRRQFHIHAMAGEKPRAAQSFEAATYRRGEIQRRPRQRDLAQDHAPGIEQIVGEPRKVTGLPPDDRDRRAADIVEQRAFLLDDLRGIGDGRQRIAQLVTQHGQELVLGAAGLLGGEPRLALAGERRLARIVRGAQRHCHAPHLGKPGVRHARHFATAQQQRLLFEVAHGAHDGTPHQQRRDQAQQHGEQQRTAQQVVRPHDRAVDGAARNTHRRPPARHR